jgi:hypothetical protein
MTGRHCTGLDDDADGSKMAWEGCAYCSSCLITIPSVSTLHLAYIDPHYISESEHDLGTAVGDVMGMSPPIITVLLMTREETVMKGDGGG